MLSTISVQHIRLCSGALNYGHLGRLYTNCLGKTLFPQTCYIIRTGRLVCHIIQKEPHMFICHYTHANHLTATFYINKSFGIPERDKYSINKSSEARQKKIVGYGHWYYLRDETGALRPISGRQPLTPTGRGGAARNPNRRTQSIKSSGNESPGDLASANKKATAKSVRYKQKRRSYYGSPYNEGL